MSQTWNGYAYVTNNPVSRVDPLGLEDEGGGGDDNTVYTADQYTVLSTFAGTNADITISMGGYSDTGSPDASLTSIPDSFSLSTSSISSMLSSGVSTDAEQGITNIGEVATGAGIGTTTADKVAAAVTLGTIGTVAAGPTIVGLGARAFLGPAVNRVFWYGAGYFAASNYAATYEGTMIGETPLGRFLSFLTKNLKEALDSVGARCSSIGQRRQECSRAEHKDQF
jgi:hypothetical protein